MRIEGLYASCSPSFDPLTDRPFTHPQRYRDILLLPTRLFQLPRSFASFFSPIGFLWCSHTSYLTTLYFPLPRSVTGNKHPREERTPTMEPTRTVPDDFPTDGVELSYFLVVSDYARALAFYRDVLGATVVHELPERLGVV